MRVRRRDGGAARVDARLVEDTHERARLLDLAGRDSAARRQALLVDPSLAAVSGEEIAFGAEEVEQVRQAVRAARRMQRLQRPADRRSLQGLSALAAGLLLVLLFLIPSDLERSSRGADSPAAPPLRGAVSAYPDVEALNLPAARVYELVEEDFEVVLIVDESLELQ